MSTFQDNLNNIVTKIYLYNILDSVNYKYINKSLNKKKYSKKQLINELLTLMTKEKIVNYIRKEYFKKKSHSNLQFIRDDPNIIPSLKSKKLFILENNFLIPYHFPKKLNNNETIGQTAEYAICKFFHLNCNISETRIDNIICEQIINLLKNWPKKIPKPIKCIGYQNKAIDFKLENNTTLSVKTLKKNDGKICPQSIGQSTLKSWDKRNYTDFSGSLEKNPERLEMIKRDINSFLKDYLENTYCCTHLLLFSNCEKKPIMEFLTRIDNKYFYDKKILFERPIYEERWDDKKLKNNEFSSIIKMHVNDQLVNIGEFQFHKTSRHVLKFRFYKKFLKMI